MIPVAIMLSIAVMVTVVMYIVITWGEMREIPRGESVSMLASIFGVTLLSEALCVLMMIWVRL